MPQNYPTLEAIPSLLAPDLMPNDYEDLKTALAVIHEITPGWQRLEAVGACIRRIRNLIYVEKRTRDSAVKLLLLVADEVMANEFGR